MWQCLIEVDETGIEEFGLDKTAVDETGLEELGIDPIFTASSLNCT